MEMDFHLFMPDAVQFLSNAWAPLLVAPLISLVAMLAIVANRTAVSRCLRTRDDARARQCSHVGDPLRFGGVAVFVGIGTAISFGDWQQQALPYLLVLSAAPALLTGLLEDSGRSVSPLRRLVAAFVAAAFAVLLFDTWVTRANLPGLNHVMAIAPLALPLTMLLSAGFCHAMNLVDGMHGLAATVVISATAGLTILAQEAGEADLALFAALIGAASVGFLVLNWPFGKMFMGDAGSYGLGHMLIWAAIVLADRGPGIAVPALLLILFWPFADTVHSVVRRVGAGLPVFEPDRMHLHQKMLRCIEIALLGGPHRAWSNPLATLCLAPMVVSPVIAGVVLAHEPRAAWAALAIFAALFAASHVVLVRLAIWRRRTPARAAKRAAYPAYPTHTREQRSSV